MIQDGESDDTWTNFFYYLKDRGLTGIKLLVSDAHKRLVSSIKKSFSQVS